MESTNKHKVTNFWSGLAFGVSISAILGYLLGTKQGRAHVKKILEIAENEHGFKEIMSTLENFIPTSETIEEKKELVEKKAQEAKGSIDSIIDKIQTFAAS